MLNFGKPTASGLANVRAGWRAQVLAYGFAVTVSVLTLFARMSLTPWIGDRPVLVLFILPIIFSAYVGGLGPGLLSPALSAGGVYFFLLAPEHILWFEGSVDLWQ